MTSGKGNSDKKDKPAQKNILVHNYYDPEGNPLAKMVAEVDGTATDHSDVVQEMHNMANDMFGTTGAPVLVGRGRVYSIGWEGESPTIWEQRRAERKRQGRSPTDD